MLCSRRDLTVVLIMAMLTMAVLTMAILTIYGYTYYGYTNQGPTSSSVYMRCCRDCLPRAGFYSYLILNPDRNLTPTRTRTRTRTLTLTLTLTQARILILVLTLTLTLTVLPTLTLNLSRSTRTSTALPRTTSSSTASTAPPRGGYTYQAVPTIVSRLTRLCLLGRTYCCYTYLGSSSARSTAPPPVGYTNYRHTLTVATVYFTMVLRTMAILIRRHLAGLGLSTRFEPVAVPGGQLAPEAWDGAEAGRNWWGMDTYLLPVCVRE